jgi:hypothetical protein
MSGGCVRRSIGAPDRSASYRGGNRSGHSARWMRGRFVSIVIRESARPGLTTNTGRCGLQSCDVGGVPRVPTELAAQKNEPKPTVSRD